MATRSNNTTGNPYHDEDGKFTSENDQGTEKTPETLKVINKINPNIDISKIKSKISQLKNPLESDLIKPNSLQDAMMQGNKIIGSSKNAVGYDNSTNLDVAFEFNKALKDITKDFTNLMIGDSNIWIYGTRNVRVASDTASIFNDVTNLFNEPHYQKRIADLGLKQLDLLKLTNEIIGSVVALENGFNNKDLGNSTGGSTGFFEGEKQFGNISLGSSIKLNTNVSKTANGYDNYIKDAVLRGHFFQPTYQSPAYMVAVHELGHHVFEKSKVLFNDNDNKELESALTDGKGYANFVVTPNPPPLDKILGPFERNDYKQLRNAKEISGYAIFSQHEHVAEAFADVYCNKEKATPHNQRIVQFLKNVYIREYGNK